MKHFCSLGRRVLVALVLASILVPGIAGAERCRVEDVGGTVSLPPTGPGCDSAYVSPHDLHMIIDGLPPGTEIEIDPIHFGFLVQSPFPGGSLGGEVEPFISSLRFTMTGKGDLAGWSKTIEIYDVDCEVHTGPRFPGECVQEFPADLQRLQGQHSDQDFLNLQVTAGTQFGLPSPGFTTLSQLSDGNWNVDSFFDITYQIDFTGAPGSLLDGFSGSTVGTVEMHAGEPQCREDLNGDGVMNLTDVGTFAAMFFSGSYECISDFNNDGVNDLADLGIFANVFMAGGCGGGPE